MMINARNGKTSICFFSFNYSSANCSHSWENVPDTLWWNLSRNLNSLNINGAGFQNFCANRNSSTLGKLHLPLSYKFSAPYQPYHADSEPNVVVFELDRTLVNVFIENPFDQWTKAGEALPFDEILFFSDKAIKVQAVPYENLIFFYDLSHDDIDALVLIDSRFKGNLYNWNTKQQILFGR